VLYQKKGLEKFNVLAVLRATAWTNIHIPFNIFPGGLASTEKFVAERGFSSYPQSVWADS